MIKKILATIAKPFIGSGIGQKLPWAHQIFRQLYTASGGETYQTKIPLGLKFTVQDNDNGPGLYLRSTGVFEPFETEEFTQAVRHNDTVIDVGAHVGYYTLIASKLVGDKGKVIAFEPDQNNRELLKQNISDNKLQNITTINKAVGEADGELEFFVSTESSGDHSLVKRSDKVETIRVPVVSLDSYTKRKNLKPNVIKIDVEGAEIMVLKGMSKLLKSLELRHIFIEISKDNHEQVINQLLANKFKLELIDEHRHELIGYSQKQMEKLLNKYGFINLHARK